MVALEDLVERRLGAAKDVNADLMTGMVVRNCAWNKAILKLIFGGNPVVFLVLLLGRWWPLLRRSTKKMVVGIVEGWQIHRIQEVEGVLKTLLGPERCVNRPDRRRLAVEQEEVPQNGFFLRGGCIQSHTAKQMVGMCPERPRAVMQVILQAYMNGLDEPIPTVCKSRKSVGYLPR